MITSARAWRGTSRLPRMGKPSSDLMVKRTQDLDIKPKQNHIPILHDILFPLAAHLARRASGLLASATDVVVIGDGFRADEAALEIAVDLSCGLRRGCAAMDRPGTGLLRPGSEERLQVEQLVGRANQRVEAGFLQSHVMQKLAPLLEGKLCDLRLQLSADDDHFATLFRCHAPYR